MADAEAKLSEYEAERGRAEQHVAFRVLLESLAEPVCANAGLEGEALEEVLSGAAVNEDYTSKYELPLEAQPPVVANVGVDLKARVGESLELETQL